MSATILEAQSQTGTVPETAQCTLFVPSCDAYSDLWTPFFTLLQRHWADCPFPVVLGANKQEFSQFGVRTLNSGDEKNWSTQVRRQLGELDTPYVLMMLDDFFLRSTVKTADVLECLNFVQKRNGNMIRLLPRPAPPVGNLNGSVPDFVREIPVGMPYRCSTQGAIWKRETLLTLLRGGESIWEFEMEGTGRSEHYPSGFYGATRSVLTYDHHVVQRGKWFKPEAKRFGAMNIGCDFARRGIMSDKEMLSWRLGKVRGAVGKLLPDALRERLTGNMRKP